MTAKKPGLPADYGDATPEQVAKAIGRLNPDQNEPVEKFERYRGDDGAWYGRLIDSDS